MKTVLPEAISVSFVVVLALLLAIAGPSVSKPKQQPPAPQLTLSPVSWQVTQYTYNFDNMRVIQADPVGPSVGFTFPDVPLGWFTTHLSRPQNPIASLAGLHYLSMTFTIAETGTPVYDWKSEDGNTDPTHTPAAVHLWFKGNSDYNHTGRWWSWAPYIAVLGPQTTTITIPLEGQYWGDATGGRGDEMARRPDPYRSGKFEPRSPAEGFADSLVNLTEIGMTFGGGFYLGHGVRVIGGTSQFQLLNYSAY